MGDKQAGGWFYQGAILAAVALFLEVRVLEPGSSLWAFIAGFFVLLEANRRRRWRVRNPSDPPTAADKLARIALNFYEPAAPFVFIIVTIVLMGGTVLLLYIVKWVLLAYAPI